MTLQAKKSLKELSDDLVGRHLTFGDYSIPKQRLGMPNFVTFRKHLYFGFPKGDEQPYGCVVITFDDPYDYSSANLYVLPDWSEVWDEHGNINLDSIEPNGTSKAVLTFLETYDKRVKKPEIYGVGLTRRGQTKVRRHKELGRRDIRLREIKY